MSSNHSLLSVDRTASPLLDQPPTHGTHKVKYHKESSWDFHLDVEYRPVDLSLILPHYRARNQPIEHRMSMFVGNVSAPVKLKICRHFPQSKFYLDVQGESSDVTVWLPSDFRGRIYHSGKATFSAGFINRIMRNVRINEPEFDEYYNEDEVVVCTRGHITFRMWDVQTCAPENSHKESFKRMFGCSRKAPETAIDWDFLLKD